MSEKIQEKRPSDLTESELDKIISDIVTFYDFTFFSERDVSEGVGLVFSLEQLAVTYGMVGDWLYKEPDKYNVADLMVDFTKVLDERATAQNIAMWEYIRPNLDYLPITITKEEHNTGGKKWQLKTQA